MPRIRILLALLAFAVFGAGWLMGDDPKKPADTKTDPPKTAAHTLPQGWKQLGLSDEQKKKIYAIEDEYNPKIAALQKQIDDLKNDEKAKKYAVLTEDQKKHLKELRDAKDGGAEEKKPDPKKDDTKKDEKKP
jgi:Spy/CpxP family protein refolding chaperone